MSKSLTTLTGTKQNKTKRFWWVNVLKLNIFLKKMEFPFVGTVLSTVTDDVTSKNIVMLVLCSCSYGQDASRRSWGWGSSQHSSFPVDTWLQEARCELPSTKPRDLETALEKRQDVLAAQLDGGCITRNRRKNWLPFKSQLRLELCVSVGS